MVVTKLILFSPSPYNKLCICIASLTHIFVTIDGRQLKILFGQVECGTHVMSLLRVSEEQFKRNEIQEICQLKNAESK